MKMNYFLPVLVGLAVLSLAPDANARRNQAQQEGYVFKYKELPNVDFFKTDNFGYMDIGYTFNSTKVFGVPLWNSDVKWCGYVGREKNYIIITPAVVISRIAAYNREAKKHKWAPVDPAKVTNNREAWHALIAMYNNIGKASGKKFTPLDIKLPPKPTLPFWYRVGGKLVGGGILLVILIGWGFGSIFSKKKKKDKKSKETAQV